MDSNDITELEELTRTAAQIAARAIPFSEDRGGVIPVILAELISRSGESSPREENQVTPGDGIRAYYILECTTTAHRYLADDAGDAEAQHDYAPCCAATIISIAPESYLIRGGRA